MKITLTALALAGALSATSTTALAQAMPPPLPALSAEQSTNLNQEMAQYSRAVNDRVARGELRADEAQRLIDWHRWQLARQIAGLAPRDPPRVIVEREYVPRPYAWNYDPFWAPGPYYYGPRYYWGPSVSVCAGGRGRHSFGSICF